ncbi:MAG: T9SS type A sorting domain-containing protein [Bacteroidetes bacterium]|nr:T9SS type A sorting domain-containing protein [Bacteroidota bacterium]
MSIQSITVQPGGFLAKFDSSGTCLWAKREFSPLSDFFSPKSIKVVNNEIVIGGYSDKKTITVDTAVISDPHYISSWNYYAGFLAKFDSLGKIKWAKFFGSPCAEIYSIDVDVSGNIYSAGWFANTCFFDSIPINGINNGNMFVVKSNSSGNVIQISRADSTGGSQANEIQVDKAGNCFATGKVYFGSVTFGGTTLTGKGAFLVKYLPEGSVQWAKQIKGGQLYDYSIGLSVNSDGSDIAVAGDFTSYISPDSSITLHNSGSGLHTTSDVFVFKYDGFVGIEENNLSSITSLKFFPNPTSGKFTAVIPYDFKPSKVLTLSLIDKLGKVIFQENIEVNGDYITRDMKNMTKGFYIVSLSDGKKQYFGKLLLQ